IIDTEINLAPFITVAHVTVENTLAAAGVDEATLKEIERWLAAHFACVRDPRVRNKSVDDASVSYEGRFGMARGLESTQYGQQALALDYTGTLARLGERKATFSVIGGR